MDWTAQQCSEAESAIKSQGTLESASGFLSKKWKTPISREMLKSALYRNRRRTRDRFRSTGVLVPAILRSTEPTLPVDFSEGDEGDEAAPTKVPRQAAKATAAAASPLFPAWRNYIPRADYKEPKRDYSLSSKARETSRGIVIPDVHVPHAHKAAWECTLGILKDWQPEFGVIIGDFMDCEALSRHAKSKPDLTRLASEYYATNVALDELQSASPNTIWTYLEGNHERRAVKFMNEQGNLDGMLSVPENLYITKRASNYHRDGDVKLRGMTWIPYEQQPYITAHSAYYHGYHYTNKQHAATHADQFCFSKAQGRPLFYGHMHTFQHYTSSNGSFAQCIGFLGDEDALKYTEGRPNPWVHGLVTQEVSGSAMTYTTVKFDNERTVFNGKVYSISR